MATGAAKNMLHHSCIGGAHKGTRRTIRTHTIRVSGHLILRSSWGKEGTGQSKATTSTTAVFGSKSGKLHKSNTGSI
nr:uncharacterized protein LOC108054391 isoform X3 [Drosophila takahashii]